MEAPAPENRITALSASSRTRQDVDAIIPAIEDGEMSLDQLLRLRETVTEMT
ncbi:hypothetical protein ACTGJ9_001085 [Bradyrhizobium sp. RDM12]